MGHVWTAASRWFFFRTVKKKKIKKKIKRPHADPPPFLDHPPTRTSRLGLHWV